ncbi:hypothetical protein AGMMS49944_21670 [Spirochaetia bacterium]|nr:hypothetical protein AGMMS49944_21670 [Spirochaetia bacterium]
MAGQTIKGFTKEQIEYFRETSKLKYELDMQSRETYAREEGREIGREEGRQALSESQQALVERDRIIAEKDRIIAELMRKQ